MISQAMLEEADGEAGDNAYGGLLCVSSAG
jgi:hypothetical protein